MSEYEAVGESLSSAVREACEDLDEADRVLKAAQQRRETAFAALLETIRIESAQSVDAVSSKGVES